MRVQEVPLIHVCDGPCRSISGFPGLVPIDGDILTHNGGNGTSCSVFMIAPDENVAACVLMNLGTPEACKTRDPWCRRLLHLAKRGEFGPVPKE
jgi:hypothetical protein